MPPEQTPNPVPQREPFNFWETDSKKNFAPWFLIFCTVLIVIGLGVAGYFKYQAYQQYKAGLAITQQEQTIATSTWQTYRNEEFGFEIKLPPKWADASIKKQTLESSSGVTQILLELKVINSEEYTRVCHFGIYPDKEWAEIQNVYEPYRPVFIASKNGFTYGYGCGHEDFGYENFEEFNRAVEAGELDKINSGQIMGPFQEFHKLILPTFKFIEPIPKDWKTYRNEEYGFEVRYPTKFYLTEKVSGGISLSKDPNENHPDIGISTDLFRENWTNYVVVNGGEEDSITDVKYGDNNYKKWIEDLGDGMKAVFYSKLTSQNKVITIGIWSEEYADGSEFQQILSTFKFIEPTKTSAEGQFCGGFAGVLCPSGYQCKYDGSYPDAGGKCTSAEKPVFCTADAMMCPDGSYVGRTGPKCEFVCPK